MSIKRRNKINEQFATRLVSMLESPAWCVLSLSARRVIERIEIELAHHGGNDNGRLPVPYNDFVAYGIERHAIAPAIREAEALGFIKLTQHGRGGNAEHRQPNLFGLTFAYARDGRDNPPTHDWRKIKTGEEAVTIARAARAAKDERAVSIGRFLKNRRKGFRDRCGKPTPGPVRETPTENQNFPVRETRTTGSVGKPALLSISPLQGRARGRRELPSDWQPSSADLSFAAERGFESARAFLMADAFADYHRARGSRMADWPAAWRTWVTREVGHDLKARPPVKRRAW